MSQTPSMPNESNPGRALVYGYFGEGNLGDDLLLSALVDRASEAGLELVAAWGDASPWAPPCDTVERSAEVAIERLDDADHCIVGPGGLFHNARVGRPYFDRGLLHIDRITAHAHALHIPIRAIGVGIGPLHGPTSRRVTARILRRCSDIAVRDDTSHQFAVGAGIPARRIEDLAIGAFRGTDSTASGGTTVALNLRPWGQTNEQEAREAAIATALRDMLVTGEISGVVGVPMSVGSDPRTSDIPPLDRVIRRIGDGANLLDVTQPADVIDAVAAADAVLAMRLHAAILGANHGIPTIGIPYNEKVRTVPRTGTMTLCSATTTEEASAALRSALSSQRTEPLSRVSDAPTFVFDGALPSASTDSGGGVESVRLGIGL